jgi:DNA (cytosine-5)-methyltransferase 1
MGADEYMINAPLNKALFGFGDAVCVPVIEWIARNYLNPIIEEMHKKSKEDIAGEINYNNLGEANNGKQ